MTANEIVQEVNLNELDPILEGFKEEKWALIPLLQQVQEHYGYIPPETIEPIALSLRLFPSEVQGVVTFYSQFYTTPRGKNIIRVCRGTACHVRGSGSVLKILKQNLDLEPGETTPDLNYTLETVACLGACFLAPTMMVNREYYGKLAPPRVMSVLTQYAPPIKEKGHGEG
jgi:NADH-quinone oxidoreductase E subunit